MQKAVAIMAAGLLVCATCHAEQIRFVVSYGTNGTARVVETNKTVKGWVEEIYVDAPAAGVTGSVTVAYSPVLSTMSAVNLLTNRLVTADMVVRPARDWTDIGGAALTSDDPGRYYLYGEAVTCSITNVSGSTGITWQVYLKYERDE